VSAVLNLKVDRAKCKKSPEKYFIRVNKYRPTLFFKKKFKAFLSVSKVNISPFQGCFLIFGKVILTYFITDLNHSFFFVIFKGKCKLFLGF